MRQLLTKKIIRRIEENNILYDYNDCEAMDVVYDDEVASLKPYMDKLDLTAFVFNMAIMYLNHGLRYAKHKLSEKDYENYMMWIDMDVDEYAMECEHYYNCQVVYTRRANKILEYYCNQKPLDIKTLCIYPLVGYIVGISDFYCYEFIDELCDSIQYVFIPKVFVDRYKESLK